MNAKRGSTKDTTDITIDVPVSMVEMIGLPNPAVVTDDTALPAPTVLFIAAAVPPPAMMASAHVNTGLKSAIVETITAVPATVAKGTAMVSNKLSTKGMKYPTISITVATAKVIKAVVDPSHCQDSFNSHKLKYEAALSASKGTNILKPTEAARPIPKAMLKICSAILRKLYLKLIIYGRRRDLFQKEFILKPYEVQFLLGSSHRCIQPS